MDTFTSLEHDSDRKKFDKNNMKTNIITEHVNEIHELKKVDILLSLIVNVINKKEENESCICSYCPLTSNYHVENEVVPDIEVNPNTEGKIKLSEIIIKLKQLGYPLTGSMIAIYSKIADEYVTCGADPLDKMVLLDQDQVNYGILKLKCTCFIDEKYLCRNSSNYNTATTTTLSRNNSTINDKKSGNPPKRTKERKIGYIIEKVNQWRRLYNGFYNEEGKFIKHTLDDAAKLINISKKSLDDYLLQLRLGRKFGFNFNGNKDNKVGVLRSFVKKNRFKNENVKNESDED